MQPLEKEAGRKEKERLQPISVLLPSPFFFLRSEIYLAGPNISWGWGVLAPFCSDPDTGARAPQPQITVSSSSSLGG
jgi:hypothetical protein